MFNNIKSKLLIAIILTLSFIYTFLINYIWTSMSLTVSKEFSLSATQTGLFITTYYFGYLSSLVPGGLLADKYQPKDILIKSITSAGILTFLLSFIPSFNTGLILRTLIGLSCGLVMPSCSKIISYNFNEKERIRAMGVLLASPPAGISLANSVGPILISNVGWRNTFRIFSLMSIIIITIIYIFINKFKLLEKQKAVNVFLGIKTFLRNKSQILLSISGLAFLFITTGVATWLNAYLLNMGIEIKERSIIITTYSIFGIFGSCFSGYIAQKLRLRSKTFIFIVLIFMCICTLTFLMPKLFVQLLIISAIFGFIAYLPSTHYTQIAVEISEVKYSATTVSAQNLIMQFSGVIQPILIGFIIDKTSQYEYIFYVFLLIEICSILLLSPVKEKYYKN